MPHRIEVGNLAVVAPGEGLRLNRRQWAWLEMAMVADNDGEVEGARGLIGRLEQELGVTKHDRLTVAGGEIVGEFVSIDIGLAKPARLQAQRAERKRVRSLICDRPVPLSEAQERDLADAEVQRDLAALALARKDTRTSGKALTAARLLELRAKESRARQLERVAQDQTAAEIADTAARRGEKLVEEDAAMYVPVHIGGGMVAERLQRVKRVRNLSRDGLESLLDTEKDAKKRTGISHIQYVAGLRYRDLYEGAQAELRSQMGSEGSGGGATLRCGTSDQRLWYRDALEKVERKVVQQAGHRPLTTLQSVAGRAQPLTDLAQSGSLRAALKAALIKALDVVADHFGIH
jgi:hypothetical protein